MIPKLDQALAALLLDLDERGLLGETLVLVMGEFGRTPKLNSAGGRDHWPRAFSVLLAGGGVQGRPGDRADRRAGREPGRAPDHAGRPRPHGLHPARDRPRPGIPHRRRPPGQGRVRRRGHPRVPVLRSRADDVRLSLAPGPARHRAAGADDPERVGPIGHRPGRGPGRLGMAPGSQAGVVFRSSRDGRERHDPDGSGSRPGPGLLPRRLDPGRRGREPGRVGGGGAAGLALGRPRGPARRARGHRPRRDLARRREGPGHRGGRPGRAGLGRARRAARWPPWRGIPGRCWPWPPRPTARWLCSGGADATIRVWEPGPWRSVRSLNNHLGPVHALAFRPAQPGGRPATLASAGGDSTVPHLAAGDRPDGPDRPPPVAGALPARGRRTGLASWPGRRTAACGRSTATATRSTASRSWRPGR